MRPRFDFVLHSPNTGTQLLVEAKTTEAPSKEWATRLARNLLAHTNPTSDLYFLLVLRNYLYLWKHVPRDDESAPDYAAPTSEVFKDYLVSFNTSLQQINGPNFELLVKTWLDDWVHRRSPKNTEKWIRDAGLEQFVNGVLTDETR